jgi:pimeloyl-ACP methyl ester carboxylesterase
METIEVDAVEVRYEISGDGEPVVCIHANPFVDWYLPLIERMPGYAMLRYTRRPVDDTPLSVAADAATCRHLAKHVGWERSHVIGHSAGALTAVQLAADAPDLVHSLSLLEPAVASPSNGNTTSGDDPFVAIIEAIAAGDYETATERFLTAVCGHGSRPILERAVPGAFEHAVEACEFFFRAEVPAINAAMASVFTPELTASVTASVLNVVGERSEPGFIRGADSVQSWFPHAERFTLPDATHFLMVEQPDRMAAELRRFLRAHPIK